MRVVAFISNYLIPFVVFYVIVYGFVSRVNVFEKFVKGAKESIKLVVDIFPTLLLLILAVNLIRVGGIVDIITEAARPIARLTGFPMEVVPVVVVKCFSSSAAVGLLLDIYKNYGTDSQIGLLASTCLAASETIVYTIAIYCSAVKITKSRWTIPAAIISTIAGVIVAFLLC